MPSWSVTLIPPFLGCTVATFVIGIVAVACGAEKQDAALPVHDGGLYGDGGPMLIGHDSGTTARRDAGSASDAGDRDAGNESFADAAEPRDAGPVRDAGTVARDAGAPDTGLILTRDAGPNRDGGPRDASVVGQVGRPCPCLPAEVCVNGAYCTHWCGPQEEAPARLPSIPCGPEAYCWDVGTHWCYQICNNGSHCSSPTLCVPSDDPSIDVCILP